MACCLVRLMVLSHYQNQYRLVVSWTLKNKLLWNLNQNKIIFIQENAFENFIWRKVSHFVLTHWGRVTHICVSKQTIIGSDNGLSPGWRQAIIWTNAGILLIGTLGTNFSQILIEIRIFSFKKMGLKVSSAKWRPFCLGLNVLSLSVLIRWPMELCDICHIDDLVQDYSNSIVNALELLLSSNYDMCNLYKYILLCVLFLQVISWWCEGPRLYARRFIPWKDVVQ